MAIDFTLTPQQRELQLESRRFAAEVLAGARAAELLPTAEERFLATRPAYEAMVVAGFLRKCIPQPAGGENAGMIDTAIMAEEFYSVNASVTLTMIIARPYPTQRRGPALKCFVSVRLTASTKTGRDLRENWDGRKSGWQETADTAYR